MSEHTSTVFKVERGAGSIHHGTRLGNGVTLGKVNGGYGISTSAGSVSISKSHHHHQSHTESGFSSRMSGSLESGATMSSRTSRESFVSTPTLVNGGHSAMTTIIESGVSSIGGGTVVESSKVAITGAQMFAEATMREKEEMQRLNDRLSNYIARVKQLEEQNKQLVASLGELRGRWGNKNESFKSSFSSSILQIRTDKDAASRLRIAKDISVSRLSTDIADFRTRIDETYRIADVERKRVPQWIAAISDADNELAKLIKRFESLQAEERLSLNEGERLRKDLSELYVTLDGVLVDKLAFQAQMTSIRDEIKFLRTVQSEEVRELQALLVVAPADTKEFFRSELALAVRDIRKEYALLASAGKVKLESWYKSKVHGIQELAVRRVDENVVYVENVKKMTLTMTELSSRYAQLEGTNHALELDVSKLQRQLTEDTMSYEKAMADYDNIMIRMREECATLVAELQSLLDSKALLDGEIAIYRAMIEGEERRVGVVVQRVEEEHSDQWEVATKTKFNTVAHGHVAIIQSEPTGRFIVITNNSDFLEERIGGWRLKRVIDNGRELNYYFPAGFVIRPRQKIRIFASGQGSAGADSLVFEAESSWGMGANITTALYNAAGEERAVYTQRTVVANA